MKLKFVMFHNKSNITAFFYMVEWLNMKITFSHLCYPCLNMQRVMYSSINISHTQHSI